MEQKMHRAYLVDDESLARERLRRLLETSGIQLEIAGESGDAAHAVNEINTLKPDVVFLDIQMPVLDGFDVVSMLEHPRPYIIFVTAYDQFALKAFEVFALDYLTKPVRLERLKESLLRLSPKESRKPQLDAVENLVSAHHQKKGEVIGLKRGNAIKIMPVKAISYFEADEKLVYAYTPEGRMRSDLTLQELEEWLEPKGFMRTHRAFLVRTDEVKELIPWFAGAYELKLANGTNIPVSRRKVAVIKAMLGL
jgi:two-component system LytT family response regulator